MGLLHVLDPEGPVLLLLNLVIREVKREYAGGFRNLN
jgi:hypothetical protein